MESDKRRFEKNKHLFRVDIMIEESTPTLALAALLQALNHPKVDDFRIMEGIQFGKAIESALKESKAQPVAIPPNQSVPATSALHAQSRSRKDNGQAKPAPSAAPYAVRSGVSSPNPDTGTLSLENLMHFQENGTLVRLAVVKSKGVRLSIPCRILNFDAVGQQLTIYHVDEKKVYSFMLNEIEDITV